MDLKGIECKGVDSTGSGPAMNYCKYDNEHSGSIKDGEFLE